ncbi:MAG: hypothetical protein ACREYF_00205, partial [Gammaproteobacteria bacterium]
MKLFYRIAFIASFTGLVFALSSCGRQEAPSVTAGKMQVRGAGATFPAPLYEKWIETYRGQNREFEFSYD